MNVGQLKQALENFNDEVELVITDGFKGLCYRGDFAVQPFEEANSVVVDIGIGGCEENL